MLIDFSYPAWKTKTAPGAMKAIIESAMNNMETSSKSQINAVSYIRNVIYSSGTPGVIEQKRIIGLPLDAPAETLCAVIVTGSGQKYYIWRKTAKVRTDYDYNRYQAVIRYTDPMYP